jgi:trigger factor
MRLRLAYHDRRTAFRYSYPISIANFHRFLSDTYTMKVTQEKLDRSRIGLQIEVTPEKTNTYYERAIKDLTSKANIPGFRRGKIPRQVILQRIGSVQIKAMALELLMEEELKAAIKQESVPAIGNYEITSNFEELIQNFTPGQPLTFAGAVDVPAEPTLGNYVGLDIKAEEVKYQPEKVDEFLEERRRENSTAVPVDRAAQMDDITTVDYSGVKTDGTKIDGAQATDFEMELSEGRFISDLMNGIVGMKVGETKEIPVTFPEDYPREDLANAPATFTVTLKDLKVRELPNLDDDFAQEVSDFDSLAEFRADLEKRFQEQAEKATTKNVHEAIATALIDTIEVELPETTIDREVLNILNQMANQFSQYGMDVNKLFTKESIPKMKENCRPDAIANIKREMAVAEVAKAEKIEASADDIAARISEIMPQLAGQDVDEKLLYDYVADELRQEKTFDWLRDKSNVELVPEGTLETDEEEDEEIPDEE